MKGYLVLENGRVFSGKLLNDCLMAGGEVVFTTAMIGYQEIITDPSYFGQIVVMTYPLVGNVGFNEKSFASRGAMVQGLVLREATAFPSHWEMETDLISFLNKNEVAVLTEVDTRALTRVIRNEGIMGGIITDHLDDMEALKAKAKAAAGALKGDLVQYVTRKNTMKFGEKEKNVVLLDMGTKKGVLDSFLMRNCCVTAMPADSSAEEIMAIQPDGIFISDGPGDPRTVPYAVETVKQLIGKAPMFGVGLGHQMIALAMGAEIYKLDHGHRGSNHPVKHLKNERVYITTQNHGFAIDEISLAATDIEVTMRSLNDHTVEGIKHKSFPIFSVQFDPEGYPGYSDTGIFYDEFIAMF
ncbi:MAG: glutamine-hydrolyzing carbamoyl-phosphate synthase small subunit [Bacillota bacterium]|nr:glutamine-hydrolyzing carbamoyl-phosphate synthase small subunit [Bacillota bacterium]